MKLECPRCGSENQTDETEGAGARRRACASCGADLYAREGARRASQYDGYEVARRVLKVVPVWFLLCLAGFVAALLFFKWASRPVGESSVKEEEFRNEATNQQPPTPTPPDSHANAKPSERTREDATRVQASPTDEMGDAHTTEATGAQVVSEAEEAAAFSVQAGAFDDRSQANELVSRLRAAGFDARVVEAEASKRFRFQVRSGLFHTREDAARLAAQLHSKGITQTVIIEPTEKQ